MITEFEGATLIEQGVKFAVVIVKSQIVNDPDKTVAAYLIQEFEQKVFHVPVVLMAQDHQGIPTYYGRKDISAFLSNVPLASIPWSKFTCAT